MLLATTVWWPLSARLAIALIRAGCVVKAICPTGHPLKCVGGVESIYTYREIDSLGALERAVCDAQPDVIVPCDDGVVWQLHDVYARRSDLRALIEGSLGPARMYATIRSRGKLLGTSAGLGVRVPETQIIDSEQELAAWWEGPFTSAVLKLDGTWGGTGVEIVHSRERSFEAFHRMTRPRGTGFAWKRFLINRDPLALWVWRKKEKPVVTIQRFIPGRPANTMFFAWRGEVISLVTVEVLCTQGSTGAATVVRLIQNKEISLAARVLAKHFELSGFHGLDFILEKSTGAAYLVEMNPRCTQLGHLPLPEQGDLAGALYAQLSGESAAPSLTPIEDDIISFFPQASSWSPKSPYLRTSYHDVPWEEPQLVRELLLDSWPNRQLAARIYHLFRSPKRDEAVEFTSAPMGTNPEIL